MADQTGMKKILVANKEPEKAEETATYLERFFKVSTICSPKAFFDLDSRFDLMLIDHNFTPNSGIDFLMDILPRYKLPVLMLTPSGDPQCAVEALRVGAFNYIVKTGGYLKFLHIAIDDAVNKYRERQDLKHTVSELKKRLFILEGKTRTQGAKPKAAAPVAGDAASKTEPPKPERNLMEEIVSRFKKGDVNLPTLPEITMKFNRLVKKGANLKEVADFLKQDVAITSKLINVANSALYRGIEKTTRVEDAVGKLGLGKTRQYVEIIANRSLYTSDNKRFAGLVEKLWEHSLATAYASEYLLNLLHLKSSIDIFSLGLTHDIGKLVLLQVIGELEGKSGGEKVFSRKKILTTLKQYHGNFGAVLLNRWGFPKPFKDVAVCHDHFHKMDDPSPEFLCVHFANLLVTAQGFNIEASVSGPDLDKVESAYLLRLRPDDIEGVKEKTADYMAEMRKAI
ncbi:MAG: HDOD domain-containing protein [Desulfobacter sp.]|nr:MAG: HDOD domain-containing protein [Desulfobacter sp.]